MSDASAPLPPATPDVTSSEAGTSVPAGPEPGTDAYLAALSADPTAIDYTALVRALDHLRDEQRAAIFERLEAVGPDDPRYARVQLSWADGLWEQHGPTAAAVHLRRALGQVPGSPNLLHALGVALLAEDNFDEAAETLAAAAERYTVPENLGRRAGALLALARAHLWADRFGPSAEAFDRALRDYGEAGVELPDDRVHYHHGLALASANRPAEAQDAYERALAHGRGAGILRVLAEAEIATRSLARAVEHMLEAFPLEPDQFGFGNWSHVMSLLPEAERKSAEERLEAQIALTAQPATHRLAWAESLMALRRPADALAQCRLAETAAPGFDSALGEGMALERLGRREEACRRFREAAERAADDRHQVRRAASSLLRARDFAGAEPLYARLCAGEAFDAEPAPLRAGMLLDWGCALGALGHAHSAMERYHQCIRHDDTMVYAYHNLAAELMGRGAYVAGWRAWDRAVAEYERGADAAAARGDVQYFWNAGAVLHFTQGDFRGAEAAFQRGLLIAPEDSRLHLALGDLYAEWKDECDDTEADRRAILVSRTREHYRRAERAVRAELERGEPGAQERLAAVYLDSRDLERAEPALLKAIELDPDGVELRNMLGSAYAWQERYAEALKQFQAAVRLDETSLVARCNLGECYLKLERYEKAVAEYQKVLDAAPGNVEMRFGLGQTYLALGSDTEPEPFGQAVEHFSAAIHLLRERRGSVRRKPRELAEVHYLRGYARVKLWEAVSRLRRDDGHLSAAADDFRECVRLDRAHGKARLALQKIAERATRATEQRLVEAVGPGILAAIGISLFLLAQLGFFAPGLVRLPAELREVGTYSLFTSSSIAILLVGLTLPQLLKLKVAGIELEKSSVQHLSISSTPLGLKR